MTGDGPAMPRRRRTWPTGLHAVQCRHGRAAQGHGRGSGEAVVAFVIDDKLPAGCVRLAVARDETAGLGSPDAELAIERIATPQKMEQVEKVAV